MSITEVTSSTYSSIYSLSGTEQSNEILNAYEDDETEEDYDTVESTSTTIAYTYSTSSVTKGNYGEISTLYSWSTTLYSEDKSYALYTDDDGNVIGAKSTTSSSGLTIFQIAEQLSSGGDVDSEDISFLKDVDYELFSAAFSIHEVKSYFVSIKECTEEESLSVHLYKKGVISLFDILFGDGSLNSLKVEQVVQKTHEYFSKEYTCEITLENYQSWKATMATAIFSE